MRRSSMGVAAAALSALLLAACGGNDNSGGGGTTTGGNNNAPTSITIGFVGDLTGDNANLAIPPANGAQLAFDQYNATNPAVKINYKRYDSQGDPAQATNLVTQAVQQDHIVGLVGPTFSGESKQAVPVLEEAHVPNISSSATAVSLAQNGWKFWHRVIANDGVQGPGIAHFAIDQIKPKKAFVIDDKSEYGLGLANSVRETLQGGGVQLDKDSIDPKGTDYASTVNKAKAFAPDYIFFGGYYSAAGKLLKQLRDGGVTARFMSGDGSLDAGLIQAAGAQAAERAIVGCPCFVPYGAAAPEIKAFSDAYQAAFKTEPVIYAAEAFDAATAFIKAVQAGNTTGDAINDFLKTVNFTGVSKPIAFEPDGQLKVTDIWAYQVVNGKLQNLGKATEAKLQG